MQEKIQSLRARIDHLNLQILDLLSARANVAAEIGALQSASGSSQYDPVREQVMLDALVAANQGPFDAATVKSLFKQVFQASMQQSQQQEKRAYLTSRAAHQADTVVEVRGVPLRAPEESLSCRRWRSNQHHGQCPCHRASPRCPCRPGSVGYPSPGLRPYRFACLGQRQTAGPAWRPRRRLRRHGARRDVRRYLP